MTFDKEEDKNILLQIIQSASIPGGAVLAVADLVVRIKEADVANFDEENV